MADTATTQIRILPTFQGNVRAADFPGWGADNYADFLVPPVAGTLGVITSRESHGSNPWTRWSLRLADGSRTSGAVEGIDFEVVR